MFTVTFFCNHWVSLSTLRVFLVSALYYAYNTLKVMRFLNSAKPTTLHHHPLPPLLITVLDGVGWWWVLAGFSYALKIIESIVKAMT